MDSDHSESVFHYPDEVEKFSDKENIGLRQKENQQKAQFTMASVQKYMLTQRPENTVKKQNTAHTFWKDYFLRWARPGKLKKYLQGNFTNHTVRKTCISCLMDAEVPVN